MTSLKACLKAAAVSAAPSLLAEAVQGNTMFLFNTIIKAETFDPFTHVYIIDVDFPPDLWEKLATMWNHSNLRLCQYLICYAAPKYLAEYVFFAVKLVAQTNTLMHGFLKIHMVYVYRCTQNHILCNPLFKSSYNLVKGGLKGLKNIVNQQVKKEMNEQSPLTT